MFLPLKFFSSRTDEIVESLLAQDPQAYLPEDTDPTLVSGYVQQKKTLAAQFQSDASTVLEVPFSGGSSFSIVLLKCLSRGTIHIAPEDDGIDSTGRGNLEPVLDYRSFSNPLDLDLVVELLKGTRQFMSSAPMIEALDPVEISPGANVTNTEELKAWIASRISPSTGHPIGTASLAPRELGGVVGPDLRVYGTSKLSVADNSIMPLIPSTHTSSTAYAIGEKVSWSRYQVLSYLNYSIDDSLGCRYGAQKSSRVFSSVTLLQVGVRTEKMLKGYAGGFVQSIQ